ncbi:uncharacterized protein LOC129921305 [Episyrphus balteatus]|uniref:uncharacterized protein LOC129921305 n=1 Tax=Episyrphus balteatus TaxID=286459 RepID=UPI0024864D5F|nr:uncharacterized protein LOC129921305 [Episyrphus balteatus]
MQHFKFMTLIFIYFVIHSTDSLEKNDSTSSVEKNQKIASMNQTNNNSPSNSVNNNAESINNVKEKPHSNEPSETKIFFQPYPNEVDIPESFKMGFYFFIGLSITGIVFILLKINRMRLSRAERKYGVHGDRTTQELTPLPMAIEDDSDNEDHTVFDINRQIRVS